MFGIGLPELIVILGVALIVVGPDKLPELAKSLAKGMLELKKTASTLKENLEGELHDLEDDPWRQNLDKDQPPQLDVPNRPDFKPGPPHPAAAGIDHELEQRPPEAVSGQEDHLAGQDETGRPGFMPGPPHPVPPVTGSEAEAPETGTPEAAPPADASREKPADP